MLRSVGCAPVVCWCCRRVRRCSICWAVHCRLQRWLAQFFATQGESYRTQCVAFWKIWTWSKRTNHRELRDESADAFAVRVLVSCIAACSPSLTQLPNVPQRRGNALARIVGICAAAEQLATPLGALERTARLLRAQRVLLYPRFRDAVKAALERRDADVSVLAQPLSVRMRGVQTALLALIALCVAELRRAAGQVSQAAAR